MAGFKLDSTVYELDTLGGQQQALQAIIDQHNNQYDRYGEFN